MTASWWYPSQFVRRGTPPPPLMEQAEMERRIQRIRQQEGHDGSTLGADLAQPVATPAWLLCPICRTPLSEAQVRYRYRTCSRSCGATLSHRWRRLV